MLGSEIPQPTRKWHSFPWLHIISLFPLSSLRWRWNSRLYFLFALSENSNDLICCVCEALFFHVLGWGLTPQNSHPDSQLHGNTDKWLQLWYLNYDSWSDVFLSLLFLPKWQWIMYRLLHTHLALLAVESKVNSFRAQNSHQHLSKHKVLVTAVLSTVHLSPEVPTMYVWGISSPWQGSGNPVCACDAIARTVFPIQESSL